MDVSEEKSSRNRHLVQLQRVNNSETMCRMRYSIILGNHKPQFDSKLRDELFDFTGSGEGIYFSDDYMAFTETDGDLDCMLLPMTIHLRSSTFVSHIKLSLIGETDDPRKDALATVFVDKDRQSWRAMAHSSPDETLAVTVLYQDLRNVPAGYLRYVCWTCKVLSLSGYVDKSILVDNCPLENFYVQNAQSDRGVCMSTKMSIQQILAPDSVWLNRQESRLTVEINWLASHLLVQPTYNAYDHVLRRHAVQLRREVEALQAENFSLEKDMHSYQQSIASKCASSNHSQATTPIGELNPLMPHGSATHTRAPGHHRGSTGSVHSGKSVAFSTTQSPRRLQLEQENWREAPMTAPSTGRRASGDRRASDSRRTSDTEGHLLPSVPIDSGLKESRSSHYHRNNSSESTAADYGRESIPRRPYGESPHRQRRQPSPTARVDDNLRRNSAHQTLPVDDRLAAVQTRRFSANPNPGQIAADEYEAARSPRHRSHVNRNRIDERNQYPEGHYSSQRPPIDHTFDTYRK
uniref:Uncharacterized protein n=1 Tax=Plectus sambesii TaxID=2011161 RepID=A0A914VUN9_9BILA